MRYLYTVFQIINNQTNLICGSFILLSYLFSGIRGGSERGRGGRGRGGRGRGGRGRGNDGGNDRGGRGGHPSGLSGKDIGMWYAKRGKERKKKLDIETVSNFLQHRFLCFLQHHFFV